MEVRWETELARLLTELSSAQDAVLEVLSDKRKLLAAADAAGLDALQPREQAILSRLTACLEWRSGLLARAAEQGLPADCLQALATALPAEEAGDVRNQIRHASARSRLLQHHSLTNWVLVQRTLLHLSQLIEIIATGGRSRPTYGKGAPSEASGALVDQAA